jgi:glycosyltransferase involved in cell wall biosynthesis
MEKVLFVTWGVEFGGLEIVLLDWLSRIDYSKVLVVLCCRSDILLEKLTAKGLPVECVKLAVPEKETFWKLFPKWLRIFSSIRPQKIVFLEGVVGQFSLMSMLAAWCATRGNLFLFAGGWGRSPATRISSTEARALRFGFPPRLNLYRFQEIFEQRLRGRLARQTLVMSQALKNNLQASFGYPGHRTSILYHGVDTKRFQPFPAQRHEFRRTHGIPDNATVIVSHGRLARVKRVDRILKAFEVLSTEHEDLWLLLTDYGPLKDEVARFVASSDNHLRVKLVGFQQDTTGILKAGDIYVMASDTEGFGIALVEAMSTGLVCVATNCGGPAEIVVNGENGILVDVSDEAVLAGLRHALLLSTEERRRLIAQARRTVEERFEIHAAVRRALDSMAIPRP